MTYTHIEDGDWEHRCEELLDSSSVQWRDGRWVVFYLWGVKVITHCPYCGSELEKMPDKKLYHKANLVDKRGRVSPSCAERPRALNLKRSSWTFRWEAVTCPKCLAKREGGEE